MTRYIYDGPVVEFGKFIANRWQGETYAVSERRARSNLSHQFKTKHNRLPSAKITLPGKLLVDGKER